MMGKTADQAEELIRNWHLFFSNIGNTFITDQHKWAVIELNRMVNSVLRFEAHENSSSVLDECWQLTLTLINSAPSRRALVGTATGPFKQLMEHCFTC
jgi:hypothetical protein